MRVEQLLLISLFPCGCSSVLQQNQSSHLVVVEEKYLQWVQRMETSSKHTILSPKAKNKHKACKTIKVDKNRKVGQFATVQEAIASIPTIKQCRVVVTVGAGIYREKVEVPAAMAYVTLIGAGRDKTVIEWDDTADKMGHNGQLLGTYASATFAVNSPYFIAQNITFKNKAPAPPSGTLEKQAVALKISADKAAFIGCKVIEAQDTLYDHFGRHYFKDCYIQGSVDFVFGNGLSLYDRCHLHAVTNGYGAHTAQKRESMLEETGFSFVHCKITGSGVLFLGRAWGAFSRVVLAYTYMDKIITPRGWYDWGDKNRQTTVFYGQFKCSGPGANYGQRVPWSRELLLYKKSSHLLQLVSLMGINDSKA